MKQLRLALVLALAFAAGPSFATYLAGNQGGTTPAASGSPQSNATDAVWHNAGDVVIGSGGTVTAARINMNNWTGGITGVKVSVFTGAGAILGTSAEFTSADGTGLLSKSLTLSRSLTGSETIFIVAQSTGGYMEPLQYSDQSITVARAAVASFNYGTPPSTLPSPFGTATVSDWVVWLDGTTSGGTFVIPTKGPKGALGGPVGLNAIPRAPSPIPQPQAERVLMAANDATFRLRASR